MEELSHVVLPHSSSSCLRVLLLFLFVSSTYNEEIRHVGFSPEEGFGCVSNSGWDEVSVAPNLASFQQPISDFDHPFFLRFISIFQFCTPQDQPIEDILPYGSLILSMCQGHP